MTIEQCYQQFGGDYAGVSSRLRRPETLKRLLLLFLQDTNMDDFLKAKAENRESDAFRAVHTLKGLALNMGFTALAKESSDLTELFRNGIMEGREPLTARTREEYKKVVDALRQLDQ